MSRQYLPTFAELIDRLSIVQMKAIFIPENKEAYEQEIALIMHDIDEILNSTGGDAEFQVLNGTIKFTTDIMGGFPQKVNAKMIRAMLVIMLTNRFIWENESKARLGGSDQDKFLKLTHSINGVRNTAKNIVAQETGERVDLKIDALAAELTKEFGNWNIKWE